MNGICPRRKARRDFTNQYQLRRMHFFQQTSIVWSRVKKATENAHHDVKDRLCNRLSSHIWCHLLYSTRTARHSTALTHTSQLIISQKSFSCKQQQLVVYDQYCKCDCLTASAEVCKPVRLKIPLTILVTAHMHTVCGIIEKSEYVPVNAHIH